MILENFREKNHQLSCYTFINRKTCMPLSQNGRDENGSDTDGYHRYYICFHIFVRIQIRIRIVSTMSDRIRLDIDIINM